MAVSKQTYEGCEIVIEDGAKLFIDGKLIECEQDVGGRKWSTRYLPYTQYDSQEELAKDVARNAAEFRR